MPVYLAHSANTAQKTHLLREHLKATGDLAASFAIHPWQFPFLRLAGLLHDLGKYQPEFQAYLCNGGKRGSVRHACWGAMLAKCLGQDDVSFAVDGHHAGLPDESRWRVEHTFMGEKEKTKLTNLLKAMIQDTGLTENEISKLAADAHLPSGRRDTLIRFLFSCLTDADWLNTEKHFAPEKYPLRTPSAFNTDLFLSQIEEHLNSFSAPDKPINQLRIEARLEALKKTGLGTGFFSLNLPTGLGKTLTSVQWALLHAKKNNLQRIIIVLPYVNIIDQTAGRLKEIFGEENVLEHHASYLAVSVEKNEDRKELDCEREDRKKLDCEREDRKKLACENWDYPIIVTTTVQFYESLFSNSPSKCRKVHNIGNAVVILDEVQTLNKELVVPTLDILQDIHKVMNTSFVFCTATMPDFEKREAFNGIDTMVELVPNAEDFFNKTQRVSFEQLDKLNPVHYDTLLESISASAVSTLVIVNTKKLAKELFLAQKATNTWDKIFHLSTSMCPHHRKKWIANIASAVKDRGQKILVLSTQLVEAGVDLDFPCVFRELAPLESIIQAAGRCNREGLLPQLGKVVLFQLKEVKYPDASYKTQAEHTALLLKKNLGNIASHTFFKKYYEQIHNLYITQKLITAERDSLNFKDVNDMYKIIESNTRSVIIADYDNDARKTLEVIRQKERLNIHLTRDDFRSIQPYCVQVYESFLNKNHREWEEIKNGIFVWNGGYSEETGIDTEIQYTAILDV